nr:hypothetical protein [Sphingomonas sp. PAMC 26621]
MRGALVILWLAIAIVALRHIPAGSAAALKHLPGGFWLAALAYVLVHPLADLAIFRRLWGVRDGMFGAMTRRFLSNELMFAYSGDVYLFAWARTRGIAAPLHAIKDVSVLSALVGNGVTIALVVPFLANHGLATPGLTFPHIALSCAVVIAPSIGMIGLRRRLLRMTGPDALFVTGVHLVRAVAMLGLLIPVWLTVEPGLTLDTCVLFLTLRQLISRLPFMPGKDMLFAGAVAAIGKAGGAASIAAALGAFGVVGVEVALSLVVAAATLPPPRRHPGPADQARPSLKHALDGAIPEDQEVIQGAGHVQCDHRQQDDRNRPVNVPQPQAKR